MWMKISVVSLVTLLVLVPSTHASSDGQGQDLNNNPRRFFLFRNPYFRTLLNGTCKNETRWNKIRCFVKAYSCTRGLLGQGLKLAKKNITKATEMCLNETNLESEFANFTAALRPTWPNRPPHSHSKARFEPDQFGSDLAGPDEFGEDFEASLEQRHGHGHGHGNGHGHRKLFVDPNAFADSLLNTTVAEEFRCCVLREQGKLDTNGTFDIAEVLTQSNVTSTATAVAVTGAIAACDPPSGCDIRSFFSCFLNQCIPIIR